MTSNEHTNDKTTTQEAGKKGGEAPVENLDQESHQKHGSEGGPTSSDVNNDATPAAEAGTPSHGGDHKSAA